MSSYFPYDIIRPIQDEMISLIQKEIKNKNNIILHAPTGLGKTAGSLAPVIKYAIENNKKVFFLTSRNTQHKIALDTIKQIKDKFNLPLQATDFVGKKWMCIQPGVQLLKSNEFNEYCKALREDSQCVFFEQMKAGDKLSPTAKIALDDLSKISPVYIKELISVGENYKLCPYELALNMAKNSHIIITDYYYIFHPTIRENFLKKIGTKLEDCIVIVDEAHNLPERIKDLASVTLTSNILSRAVKEAKKYKIDDLVGVFSDIHQILRLLLGKEEETYIQKEKFIQLVSAITDYHGLIDYCVESSAKIREEQKQSYIGSIGLFLDAWLGSDEGFTRIASRKKGLVEDVFSLSYRCLDPSVIAKTILQKVHNVILMSGTLTPTEMYADILGFEGAKTIEHEFPSPFPKENRLNLVIGKTSTKYSGRNEEQFKEIGKILVDVINATPGNSAIFFPSYFLKDEIYRLMRGVEKTIFEEQPGMSRDEKEDLLNGFKKYKDKGAALLAVVSGSFGEGIDLPGDELKTVVVVGLPLSKPDLEIQALIEYYDKKFKKGWDYGYVFPAFNKVIQSAGRCIRSETDKGVIIFLDERFTWNNYYRCFPKSWDMKISVNQYKEKIEEFFNKK
jgi:DNA excision repair protein ERCC-2